MALSDDQLAAIREQIGATSPPTDEELAASYDRSGNVESVVLEVLRGRLADFLASPTSVSIPGIYSESHGEAVRGLRDQITSIQTGGGKLTSARLVRSGRSRHPVTTKMTPF